jgi:hypothetical protein
MQTEEMSLTELLIVTGVMIVLCAAGGGIYVVTTLLSW